jgi:hypothetical protein
MNKYLTDLRLGELLAKTGIVSVKQMSEAVRPAGNRNLHFGQMLVKSGCLKSSDLSAGIAAQSAIRDRTVDRVAAGKALETACRTGLRTICCQRTRSLLCSNYSCVSETVF